MKKFFYILAITLISTTFALPRGNSESQKLSDYDTKLAQFNEMLSRNNITDEQLEALRIEVDQFVQKVQKEVRDLEEIRDTVTSEQEEARIDKTVTRLNKVIKRAEYYQGQIREQKLLLHAKKLTQRSPPLWIPSVFLAGLTEIGESFASFSESVSKHVNYLVYEVDTPTEAISVLSFFVLAIILLWPIRIWIKRKWGARLTGDEVKIQRKLVALIATCIAGGLLPACLVISIYFYLVQLNPTFSPTEQDFLLSTLLLISSYVLVVRIITAIFAVRNPRYQIFDFEPRTARKWSHSLVFLSIFILLSSWFIHLQRVLTLPAQMTQLVLFLLFLAIFLDARTILHLVKQSPITSFLIQVFTLALPVIVLLGFVPVSLYVYKGALYSSILIVVARGIFSIISKAISQFVNRDRTIWEKITLSEKGEQFLEYWSKAFFAVVIFFISLTTLLIIWGVSSYTLREWTNKILFGFQVGSHHFSLLNLLLAIITFVALFSGTKFLQRFLDSRVFKYTSLDRSLTHALKLTAGYLGLAITVLVSVRVLGFELASVGYILGGLSVGVGLGLQPIVTNFVSGLIMLIERPVRIGDIIDVGAEGGIVTRISVRATEIRTWERATLLVPNSQFVNSEVKNWTRENPVKRYEILVGVAYGTDPELVRDTLLDIVAEFPNVAKDPKPYCLFNNFGDSSLEFSLRLYVKDYNVGGITTASKVRYEIDRIFKEKGIEIAFPQCDIHIKSKV
ncbi:MAG: mechanosensitive ion channel [Simkaniaceae bacterium]|nr:mechanosensitive ion channel [Simkaniaceae bacterium]